MDMHANYEVFCSSVDTSETHCEHWMGDDIQICRQYFRWHGVTDNFSKAIINQPGSSKTISFKYSVFQLGQ